MHRPSLERTALVLAPALALAALAPAQSRYATTVVQFNQGGGTGIFDPTNILGGPQGGGFSSGSLDVLSLGVGGDVTLGFDVTITNGPGADFTVFENGFVFGSGVFAEVALVEVSTDGVTFARFPTRYYGDPGPLPPFGTVPFATYEGLAGGLPGLANVVTNTIDPFDPVVSGGEAFDLADLADHPDVLSGAVDLGAIHFVKLVDLDAGTVNDSTGVPIWDNGGATSGCDLDAVAVIQHTGNAAPSGPTADLFLDAQGFAHCVLSDPDGVGDLDLTTLSLSLDLQVLDFSQIRRAFRLGSATATTIDLVSDQPIAGWTVENVLAVSVRDTTDQFSGDQLTLHP
ncbi:MAG: hypothetical protein AAGB93_18755 [Planctomycetota bacterium]